MKLKLQTFVIFLCNYKDYLCNYKLFGFVKLATGLYSVKYLNIFLCSSKLKIFIHYNKIYINPRPIGTPELPRHQT